MPFIAVAESMPDAAPDALTIDEIVAAMLAVVDVLPPAQRPLAECRGAVLAHAVTAPVDLPHRCVASRDGYAVRAVDTSTATSACPVHLPVVGESAPGVASPEALPTGSAFRVMTGTPLPDGADAVVRSEDAVAAAPEGGGHEIGVIAPVARGQFVADAGSEFEHGAEVLPAGTVLGPAELAVMAALGLADALVVPRPRVAVVVTGSELRRVRADPELTQLHASNGVLVTAMVEACGGVVESVRVASDDPSELADALLAALRADLVLTTGGTGRGANDLTSRVLQEREVSSLRDVKVRGSRPASFRLLRRDDRLVPHLALPGRPVAATIAFCLLAWPLLRHLSARPPQRAASVRARLGAIPPGVRTFQRFLPVRLRRCGREWEAVPTRDASLYGLAAAVGAHGFALVGQEHGEVAAGRLVQVVVPPWLDTVAHDAD